jgi:hypothetical protein
MVWGLWNIREEGDGKAGRNHALGLNLLSTQMGTLSFERLSFASEAGSAAYFHQSLRGSKGRNAV